MARTFLTAEWRNLLMANYEIEPSILKKYLPYKTELDDYQGVHYVSVVGFLFKNTRVFGIGFPFHRTFEEVNLRFYVRYREGSAWKRGVVFVKEIVPRRMISFIANSVYGEKYASHPMSHQWDIRDDTVTVAYKWRVGQDWNYIQAEADKTPGQLKEGSEEAFITEHYWGYTSMNNGRTGLYEVVHPKWKIHNVRSFSVECSAEKLYGKEFAEPLAATPHSVFLADGSPIKVMSGSKIVLA